MVDGARPLGYGKGMKAVAVQLAGPVDYEDGVRLQERLVRARIAGELGDTVLFLEHAPVLTLGARGRRDHILASAGELAARGIKVVGSSRGGDVTYHGPGQLVMYPVIHLGDHEADSRGYLRNLEEVAIRTAGEYGVTAQRREGMTGAWTEAGKIAAIGIRLRRWVTHHGMSFNVDPDMGDFALIVPCGLTGENVASLRMLLGARCPGLQEVTAAMGRHFSEVFGRVLEWRGPEVLVTTPGT